MTTQTLTQQRVINGQTPDELGAALEVARCLIAAGAPIFIARPAVDAAGNWDPAGGTGGCGYVLPARWQETRPDPQVIDRYRPGDALCQVQVITNVLDTDTQSGGDASRAGLVGAGMWPQVIGAASTPSGGTHELIAPLNVGSRDKLLPGLDLKGAKPDGTSRGMIFMPPTVKLSKVTGQPAPYRWTLEPMLEELSPADDSGLAIAELVKESQRGSQDHPEPEAYQGAPFVELPEPGQTSVGRWMARTLEGVAFDLATSARWPANYTDDRGRGWEKLQADCAYRLGRLARASWNNLTMEEARAIFMANAPTDATWTKADAASKFAVQCGRGSPAALPESLQRAVESPPDKLVTTTLPTGEVVDTITGEVLPTVDQDEDQEAAPASWSPVDLSPYLDGTYRPAVPSFLTRTDGVSMFYPGLTHSCHGESESGKSFVLQIESFHQIMAGNDVLYLDFEADAGTVTERLLLLGAPVEVIQAHFFYVKPEVDPHGSAVESAAWAETLSRSYSLAVIDGVTDSLGVFGYSTKDNDDITAWMRIMPKRIARKTGAAVVVIDHVTKDGDSRGRFAIGGQAKLAGLTGAAYTVEVASALGRDLRGVTVMRVAKDRPGYVRGQSGPMRPSDRTQETARIVIDSTGPNTVVTVEPWLGSDRVTSTPGPWRPTGIMERASDVLEAAAGPLSFRSIDERTTGKREHLRIALDALIAEGHVLVQSAPRNAQMHTLASPYRQESDPRSDKYQSAGHTQPSPDRVSVPVPYTGERGTHTQPVPGTHGEQSENGQHPTDIAPDRCPVCQFLIDPWGHRSGCPERPAATTANIKESA